MIFALRCLGVSLAFFLILYCLLSVAVTRSWRLVQRHAHWFVPRHVADVLFVIRVLPVAVATLLCVVFVIPSFLLFEPRISSEPVGEIPLALGLGCSLLFIAGAYNAWAAYSRTARAVEGWMKDATELPAHDAVRIFEIRPEVPSLTLTGLSSPKVLVSSSAVALLGPDELSAALKHEIAHVRRRDNLKKLLFRVCIFPGMSQLEAAWSAAEEMAADDEAVTSTREALDLAAALIKLSRLAAVQPACALTTALLQDASSSVNARIERLVVWDASQRSPSRSTAEWYVRPALLGSLVAVLMTYGIAIREVHTLTEWLVR